MAVLTRLKNWTAEILTFTELNNEFNNIIDNQQDIGWPRDGTIVNDFAGNELILDADDDTSITADTDDRIDFRVGGTDVVVIDRKGIRGRGIRKTDANVWALQAKVADLERRVLNREHTAILEGRVFS